MSSYVLLYTCCSGEGGRRRRRMTGVRDEEKERYDRKSLALSPPPASPETCSTHPQHSGLAPPPWIRSVSLLCFHTFSLSLLSLSSTFCCSNSIHHLFCASQTYSFSSPPLSLSVISLLLLSVSISIILLFVLLLLWILLHHFLLLLSS